MSTHTVFWTSTSLCSSIACALPSVHRSLLIYRRTDIPALQVACCSQHRLNCQHSHRTSGLTDAPNNSPLKLQSRGMCRRAVWQAGVTCRRNILTATYIPDNTASYNRRKQLQYLARSHRLSGYGSQHCALPVCNQNTGRFDHAHSHMAAEQFVSHSRPSFRVRQ